MAIRNSVKAIIVREQSILAIKLKDDQGDFYTLPGGGQEHGENVHEALKRECLEEVSMDVKIGDLVFMREYIGRNHEFHEFDGDTHQIEYMFACDTPIDQTPSMGAQPDNDQVGVAWLPLEELLNYRLYPQDMRELLTERFKESETASLVTSFPIFLGDIN